MATYFIDIDDTILRHGTNEILPGAKEKLFDLATQGHRIVLTTRCGNEEFGGPPYSREATLARLADIPYHDIIWDCPSPRIVINDDGCSAICVNPEKGLADAFE